MPRAPKKCGDVGCDERVVGRTYCETHTAEKQQRDNTTARGYGAGHQKTRRTALAQLIDGQPCSRCKQPMYANQRLELDHDDDDRSVYRGLSHAKCNARAGGSKGRHTTPAPPLSP